MSVVRFEAFTVVLLRVQIFWYVRPRREQMVTTSWRFVMHLFLRVK